MTVLYREACEADLDAVCALGDEVNLLHHEAWPHVFAPSGAPQRDRAVWATSIGRHDATMFVAESEGRLVAFVTVFVLDETNSLFQPERFARIGSISVTRSERGRGVGPRLMSLAEAWAVERGARDLRLNVWLFNEHALHVYAELGFVRRSVNLGKRLVADVPEALPASSSIASKEL